MLVNLKMLFLFIYVCVCMYIYKCIWLIPDYVFLFPSEFRDLAVRRVTRRIKKKPCLYYRAAAVYSRRRIG